MEKTNTLVKHPREYVVNGDYVIYNAGVLSNPFNCTIEYDGKQFKSVDHLLMYFKAVFFNDTAKAEEILNVSDPRLSKRLGRQVAGYVDADWAAVRENYVTYATYLKFVQNEDCRAEFLRLGEGKHFVQGSRCDSIYGIGVRFADKEAGNAENWKGTNLAGKALDKVYDAIVNNYEITL